MVYSTALFLLTTDKYSNCTSGSIYRKDKYLKSIVTFSSPFKRMAASWFLTEMRFQTGGLMKFLLSTQNFHSAVSWMSVSSCFVKNLESGSYIFMLKVCSKSQLQLRCTSIQGWMWRCGGEYYKQCGQRWARYLQVHPQWASRCQSPVPLHHWRLP